jgi:hypothetical protein
MVFRLWLVSTITGRVFGLLAKGDESEAGNAQQLVGLEGGDVIHDQAMADAGNEVTNVLVADQFGHSPFVGLVGVKLGFDGAETLGPALTAGAHGGFAATQHCSVLGAGLSRVAFSYGVLLL